MAQDQAGPRQWWIDEETATNIAPLRDTDIHVVEFSAYEDLKEAYDDKCEYKNGIPPLCKSYSNLAKQYLKEAEAERARAQKLREALDMSHLFLKGINKAHPSIEIDLLDKIIDKNEQALALDEKEQK